MPITQSPFQMPQGPQITPKTMTAAGQGGQAQPPYLQMRTQAGPPISAPGGATQQPTQPVVTPQPTAPGDTVSRTAQQPQTAGPQITPPSTPFAPGNQPAGPPAPANPPQAGGNTLGDVYKFFQSDLENQRNQALASTRADASARGVFYGTPLTGSEADINTQFLRGQGQLASGMYGNEQQNQLARLGLASNLGWQNAFNQPPTPGPTDWSALGSLFTAPRTGPTITSPTLTKQGGQLRPPPQQAQ